MRQFINRQKFAPRRLKAFTLIEIMIVVAIIGILAAIVMVNYDASQTKSRNVQRIQAIDSVKSALDVYYSVYDHYPQTAAVYAGGINQSGILNSECNAWGADAPQAVIPDLVPDYLQALPKDPLMASTGQPQNGGNNTNEYQNDKYCYIYGSDGADYIFLLHYSNDVSFAGKSEIDWQLKPDYFDPQRSCRDNDANSVCHYWGLDCDNNVTMTTDNSKIHAWKVYSKRGRCW